MDDNNWDLHAIVRGMIGATAYSSGGAATASHFSDQPVFSYPKPTVLNHKPFFNLQSAFPSPQEAKISTNDFKTAPSHNHFSISETAPICFHTNATTTLDNQFKRRRNVAKLIKNVGLKEVGSDVWSWRKYGEKRIKGSPYPRGYYRCSTSKECMARKKVEKNRSDPRMVTLIYTGEHNHPIPTHHNSLAGRGRTRLNPPPPPAAVTDNLTVDDDLFAGLDDLFSADSFSGIL